MNTIKELIYKYKAIYGWDILCSPLRRNLEFAKRIRGIVSEKDFLERCICNRMRHQQRLRQNAVDIAIRELEKEWTIIESCSDFESLYDIIYNTIAKRSDDSKTWISHCTVYDTSLRIGYSLGDSILPDKYIYVHRHLVKNAIMLLAYKGQM